MDSTISAMSDFLSKYVATDKIHEAASELHAICKAYQADFLHNAMEATLGHGIVVMKAPDGQAMQEAGDLIRSVSDSL